MIVNFEYSDSKNRLEEILMGAKIDLIRLCEIMGLRGIEWVLFSIF